MNKTKKNLLYIHSRKQPERKDKANTQRMWLLHPLQPLPPQYPSVVLYLDRKKKAFVTKPRAQPGADASPAGAQHPGRSLGGRVVGGCLQEAAPG